MSKYSGELLDTAWDDLTMYDVRSRFAQMLERDRALADELNDEPSSYVDRLLGRTKKRERLIRRLARARARR